MSDHSLILGLESRLVNAWPSFDYQAYDGWLLRLADGYTKRANSATPLCPGAALDEGLVDHIVARFVAANVRPTFRLNGLQASEVDRILAARHFREIEPTHVLAAPVDGDCEPDSEVTIAPRFSKQWVHEASAAYGDDKADEASLMGIVSRIRQQTAFATLLLDERPVAWGLGVVERGYVGLYDIVVAPDLRGIGLGRRVVLSLMAWGCTQGAHTAYLQVREENEIARSLYGALGFRLAYRYTHRVMPGRDSP
jgi:ribosomal protein S18 acetylase RimI-like enzyme